MKRLISVAVLFAALCIPGSALSKTAIMGVTVPCADLASMDAALRKYAEKPFATAKDSAGLPMVLKVNPDSGTFSLMLVMPDGMVCLMAAGRQFTAGGKIIPGQPI